MVMYYSPKAVTLINWAEVLYGNRKFLTACTKITSLLFELIEIYFFQTSFCSSW